ncbi:MAG: PASTA domain-containing protein [Acidimicrobiales bacterium]
MRYNVDSSPAPGSTIMPDIVGLQLNEAIEALADAAIDTRDVVVSTREAAGGSGRVVEQSPSHGRAAAPPVKLTTATEAVIPDVVGLTELAATSMLTAISADVDVVRIYEPGTEAGTVVAVEPTAGSVAPALVVLRVAAPQSSVYLDALELAETSHCEVGTVAGAEGRTRAFVCSVRPDGPGSLAIDIDGKVDHLTLTFGVPSTSTSYQFQLEVIVDGQLRTTIPSGAGQSAPSTVELKDARTLLLRVTAAPTGGFAREDVYLAEARLFGGEPQVAALPVRSR